MAVDNIEHGKRFDAMQHSRRAFSGVVCALSLALAGCATNDPLRDARLAWDGSMVFARPAQCDTSYAATDQLIWKELQNPNTTVDSRAKLNKSVDKIISPQLSSPDVQVSRCWNTSYEDHQGLRPAKTNDAEPDVPLPGYDLLVAEFDDQGERADVSRGRVAFERSEVALIESRLKGLLAEETSGNRPGGLNIVVFTHGWHGSASATDDYSIWFKAILEQITDLEATSRRSVCASSRQSLQGTSNPTEKTQAQSRLSSYACPLANQGDAASFASRRTVGIEITWRGDSETIPLLTWANFWDRKSAAQTVAKGAVHDLFSRLHVFYIEHSCHGAGATRTPGGEPCDAVHLLTVGHSFGALIDYHILNDDLSSGILGDHKERAYGFGDLTVLLNPAFEGEREITLSEAGLTRGPYPTEIVGLDGVQNRDLPTWPSGAQMPMLVTLQSKGDWATHYAFPSARFVTGIFENTPGEGEYGRSLQSSGWIGSYQTHQLTQGSAGAKDSCDYSHPGPMWFCPFDLTHEETQPHPLILTWQGAADRPAYLPLWTIAVDTSIMSNHDDISNPAVIRFVAQLFRAAYEQSELIHEVAAHKTAPKHDAQP